MKYLKLLFLPLLFGCALAQQTPINNPVFTGNVTFTSTPSVTNNMVYVDASNHLQPLSLGTGLSLSGGILTVTGNGGGGGGAGVFTTLQVGTDAPTTAQPIDFTPIVPTSSGSGKIMRLSGQLNITADNDQLYVLASGGSIQSISSYSNVKFIHLDLGATSVSGSTVLNSSTQLYIDAAPTAASTYGIIQAGVNDSNTFAGPANFNNNISVNGFSFLNSNIYLPTSIYGAGGLLGVNGSSGKIIPVTLQGLSWTNSSSTLTATVGTTGVSVNTTLASVAIGNYASSGEVIVSWNHQVFSDNSSFWSSGDPTKIYVPYGVTRVRVSACINWQDVSGGNREVKIKDNLGNVYGANVVPADATFPSNYCSTTSGIIDITSMGGPSYFQVVVAQDSGSTINILAATSSYFTMQVIQ